MKPVKPTRNVNYIGNVVKIIDAPDHVLPSIGNAVTALVAVDARAAMD